MNIEKREKEFVQHILSRIEHTVGKEVLLKENCISKVEHIYNNNMNSAFCCSPYYSSCKGAIKSAHSIQKKRSLSNISKNSEVYTYSKQPDAIPMLYL